MARVTIHPKHSLIQSEEQEMTESLNLRNKNLSYCAETIAINDPSN